MEKTIDKNLIIEENEKLIANILHDIKSPLYSIKIGLQSHLDSELNKDIYKTTAEVIDYIENFLVNYSFQKGKFKSKVEPCDIKEIIYKKIKSYKYLFINKNIHVDIYCEEDNFTTNSTYIFLSSIIGNLISNMAFHAKNNERASIEIYRKQDNIFADFKNYYDCESSDFSLGLEFCKNLARSLKIEFKFLKTKNEVNVSLKIPNLNY